MIKVPIEVSARHIHLSQKDTDVLFGANYVFNKLKDLSQPGQFCSVETVMLETEKSAIDKIRIVLPVRSQTQVEITITEARKLGLNPPIRISGDLKNSKTKAEIIGPIGKVILDKGIIVSKRHLHIEPELAQKLNLTHSQDISIKTNGTRPVIFNNVEVRSRDIDKLSFMIDTDEANAAGIANGDKGVIA